MTRRTILAGLLCVLMTAASRGWAKQDAPPISETEFWARMIQTQTLLAADDVSPLHTLWDGVEAVRVGDDVIQVDMKWITDAAPANSEAIRLLRSYVDALLQAHKEQTGTDLGAASAETLRQILAESRFQYGEATPEPQPDPIPLSDLPVPGADVLQPVFGFVLIVAAIGVILFVVRSLRIQSVSLPPEAGDDDPRTADEAHERAQDHESERDYRFAVRYRFLALLLLLDERGIIDYDRSLTNREHVRQITTQPHIEKLLQAVVNTFDGVWYGFIPLSEADYRLFTDQIDQLQASIT